MTDSFIAAFRARDEAYARLADIKTIPATDSDVQFKFPDLRPAPWVPKGEAWLIPARQPDETDEQFFGRCVKITPCTLAAKPAKSSPAESRWYPPQELI
jgi:hypothetical protein